MQRASLTICAALALLASASATAQQVARPAAPQVTVGANMKELTFHWEPVPGAYTYWVLEKKDARSVFTPIGVRIPSSRPRAAAPVAVHLQDWVNSRYSITACNSAGCTPSTPINPQRLMPDTIGYFKASNTDAGDFFGSSVVLSSDGSTLAVGASGESSNATGVNGNQADDSSASSGAVYVYRREGRRWKQEAYLKGGVNQASQEFGVSNGFDMKAIAVSGDGSWVVVGAAGESVNGIAFTGGVYVFRRAANGTWSLHSTLRSPENFSVISNGFGYSVDITEDGRTLKVNSRLPRGEDSNYEGRTHIYDFDGVTWTRTATVGPALPGYYCSFVRMSGDGTTLTSLCYAYPSEQFRLTTRKRSGNAWVLVGNQVVGSSGSDQMVALSFDGRTVALREGLDEKSLGIYRWTGDTWTRESVISNQPELSFPNMGHKVEFSRNAARVAIGDFQAAGVAVFDRTGNSASPWRLRSVVRPPPGSGAPYFARAISLSGSGYYLAVGAFGERSNATGIDGNRFDASAENAGAVFLY